MVPPDPGAGRAAPAPEPGLPSLPADLDHVAHAVERWEQTWPRYVSALGGRWSSGGWNTGFAPSQLRFANGARLEVLAPHDPARNPFLRRFLDRHGPGPHHLTFKVPDLDQALQAMAGHGLAPVGVDRSAPEWQEAFVHPRQAHGIVVQVAQAAHPWQSPPPEGFPTPAPEAASLLRATHVVADLPGAVSLFAGLLGGRVEGRSGDEAGLEVVDLAWAGPLGLRLVGPVEPAAPPSVLVSWLDGAPGRLHHVVLGCPDPAAVPGAVPLPVPAGGELLGVLPEDGAAAVVPPGENLGLRLVLSRTNP